MYSDPVHSLRENERHAKYVSPTLAIRQTNHLKKLFSNLIALVCRSLVVVASLSPVNASLLGQVRAHSLASSQLFVLMKLEMHASLISS